MGILVVGGGGDITIAGNVEGEINSDEHIIVNQSANIKGTIEYSALQVSYGAKIQGTKLSIDTSYDKGLSIGENAIVNIKDLSVVNSKVGVAVKDGSVAYIDNVESINNDYDLAIFVKKKEYSNPDLKIQNFLKNEKKILQSKESKLKIDNEVIAGKHSNSYINSIIY